MKTKTAIARAAPKQVKSDPVSARPTKNHIDQEAQRKYVIVAACALAALTLLVYANAVLSNGFVFDDHVYFLQNPQLRSLSNVFRILRGYKPVVDISSAFDFRPLRDISSSLDFAIWGEWAPGFHLTNVLIHSANVVLAFFLIYRITGNLPTGALTALVFSVHPIQSDSVAYISGRSDVLFALFYLIGFHFYLSHQRQPSRRTFSLVLVCLALGLLSKQMAASFPLVLFIWSVTGEWQDTEGSWWRRLAASGRAALSRDRWLYASMVVMVGSYTYYQIVVQRASGRVGRVGLQYWGGSLYANFLTVLRVHAWYLKQLIYPTPIVQYSGAFPIATTLFDLKTILSAVVVGSALGAGLFTLGRSRLISFAILSYFTLLLPVSQIIPHVELLADHYLYLPIVAFGLLVAVALKRVSGKDQTLRLVIYAVSAAVLLTLAVLTIRRNAVYKDDRTLWQTNYAESPNSPRAAYSLAVQYISLNPRTAADMFRRCISLDPTYVQAYVGLAMLAKSKEECRDAEALVQNGLAQPDSKIESDELESPGLYRTQLTVALAIVKGTEGERGEAESLLWKSVSMDPSGPQAYDLLCDMYSKEKDKQMDVLYKELSAIPDSLSALERLIVLLLKDQKYDEAMPYINRIISTDPNDVFANYQMAQIYRTRKDCTRARAYLKTAASAATTPSDVSDVKAAMRLLVRDCGSE